MAKITCNIISQVLKRTVDITVIIPTPTIPDALSPDGKRVSYIPPEKYPVIYLLHGFGNNHATWSGYTNVELYAEENQIAVVNLSAENKAYIENGMDDFYAFVSQELPEMVCGLFPISDKPENTYIAGLSMGGYGTLTHALSHPERFAAAGALSAAVIRKNPGGGMKTEDLKKEAQAELPKDGDPTVDMPDRQPSVLAERVAKSGRKFPKMYMACGGRDPLFGMNKRFRDKLISLGADVTWDEIDCYGHEWRFWDIEIEKFMEWIPRTDFYAAGGKRQI